MKPVMNLYLLLLLSFFYTNISKSYTREVVRIDLVQKISVPVSNTKNDKVINVALKDGYAKVTFYKNDLSGVILTFDTKGYNHLKANIVSEGNIRFSTVGFEGETDGPYGKEINQDLNHTGIFMLNLRPNLMAENYQNKQFKVTVYIKLTKI